MLFRLLRIGVNTVLGRRLTAPLALMLAACGQPGPLYLPSQKPPIHVQKEHQQNDTKTDRDKTD